MVRPCELDAVEARRLLHDRALSAVELLESCIEQIDAVDGALNAMVIRAFDRARIEARAADDLAARGGALPVLHGMPVAIKDLQPTEGIRTTYGSAFYEHHVPDEDAGIVRRIRDAGGIVIGKTNIPEMSIGANTVNRLFGATGNPFDQDATCGGSSGGSASALGAYMAPLATGSDHGGSLRIPACFCGVVGHRSTPGVVAHEARTIPQTFYSLQGPMGRTVADTALLQSVIAGYSRRDPMSYPLDTAAFRALDPVDVGGLRVAVTEDLGGLVVSQTIRSTFRDRVERLAGLGAEIEAVPIDLSDALEVDWKIRSDVFVAQYHRDIETYDEGFNPNVLRTYRSALETPMEVIAQARRRQMELYHHFTDTFDDFDVLLCPGVGVSPFPWRELYPKEVDGVPIDTYMDWLGLTAALTVVGHPVTALPCGLDAHGMPFGVQLVGPTHLDHRLMSIAHAIEAAFADDAVTARPVADLSLLEPETSTCRTEGKVVQLQQ